MLDNYFVEYRTIGERTRQELAEKGIEAPKHSQAFIKISKSIYLYPPDEGFKNEKEREKWIEEKRIKYKVQDEPTRERY